MACSLPMKSDGITAICNPKNSLTWLRIINTAMPLVNPVTKGRGKNLIRLPMRNRPIINNMIPAITVHINKLTYPYCKIIPYTITINAPVGPPTCTRDPPNAEIIKPAIIAVKIPASGFAPEAMANAIAKGKAITPTVTPE